MMTYLIGENWRSYFDITVVDARKPKWFSEGTVFREVDPVTSAFKLGIHSGPFKPTGVYSGGMIFFKASAIHQIKFRILRCLP